ncbi:hypothetical protein NAPIS_ORF00941 [Vairimorpha apis BRL 01]|uniref:Uncharacterized protein n=1 Tax=Vairimorpha apis BRL 01 TaxID=1037528 RepID=T0LB21_9MICR|nr:hypothetical protein NAPIS_ORF00941 [Vairimorpha apis BRL 01]
MLIHLLYNFCFKKSNTFYIDDYTSSSSEDYETEAQILEAVSVLNSNHQFEYTTQDPTTVKNIFCFSDYITFIPDEINQFVNTERIIISTLNLIKINDYIYQLPKLIELSIGSLTLDEIDPSIQYMKNLKELKICSDKNQCMFNPYLVNTDIYAGLPNESSSDLERIDDDGRRDPNQIVNMDSITRHYTRTGELQVSIDPINTNETFLNQRNFNESQSINDLHFNESQAINDLHNNEQQIIDDLYINESQEVVNLEPTNDLEPTNEHQLINNPIPYNETLPRTNSELIAELQNDIRIIQHHLATNVKIDPTEIMKQNEVQKLNFNQTNFKNIGYLYLENHNLTTLNPEISKLTNLKELSLNRNQNDFDFNEFNDHFKFDFSKLRKLLKLNLSGLNIKRIDKSILRLSNTDVEVDLRNNVLCDDDLGDFVGKRTLKEKFRSKNIIF